MTKNSAEKQSLEQHRERDSGRFGERHRAEAPGGTGILVPAGVREMIRSSDIIMQAAADHRKSLTVLAAATAVLDGFPDAEHVDLGISADGRITELFVMDRYSLQIGFIEPETESSPATYEASSPEQGAGLDACLAALDGAGPELLQEQGATVQNSITTDRGVWTSLRIPVRKVVSAGADLPHT